MKFLQIDYQILFREGMRHLLNHLAPDIELLQTGSAEEAQVLLAGQHDVDLILFDPYAPGAVGWQALKALRGQSPEIPVVVLTAAEQAYDIEAAMMLGAAGYIPKSATCQTMLNALRLVLDGGSYAPRRRPCPPCPAQRALARLTQRQTQVLTLMAEGLSNKLIARRLFVSEATVKGHVTAILSTFGVTNRVQAINRYRHRASSSERFSLAS